MGFNLGAFAGGAARGAQAQQEINERKEENTANRGFRERQVKIQEQDQAYKEEQRQRERDAQAENKALMDKHYGPQEVQDGFTEQDDGAGNIVKIPKLKKVAGSAYGADPIRDLAYVSERAALEMRRGGDMKELAPFMDYANKLKQTEQGKELFMAFGSGDTQKITVALQKLGVDPAKVKTDPKNMTIDFGSGPQPLGMVARVMGIGAFGEALEKGEERKANLDYKNAQTEHAKGENSLIPDKRAVLRGQAYQAGQAGNLSKARGEALGGGGSGASKDMINQIKLVVDKDMTGKNADPEMATFVLDYAPTLLTKGGKPQQAVAQAASLFREARSERDAFMKNDFKRLKPEVIKRLGGPEAVKARALAAAFKNRGVVMPGAQPQRTSNLALDVEED